MHVTPLTDGITDAIQAVERIVFKQLFGTIPIGRVERLNSAG